MAKRELKIEPDPDFGRFEKVLRREGEPDRVPFYELFSNIEPEVMAAIGADQGPTDPEAPWSSDPDVRRSVLRRHIAYQHALGYDYCNCGGVGFGFPREKLQSAETTEGERSYVRGSDATIRCREDFEEYPWTVMSGVDYSPLEAVGAMLPEGMKAVTNGPGGVLENVMWLLGYEGISYLLYDDEPLIGDMFDAVGSRLAEYLGTAAGFEAVGACCLGDDMGFKTATMVSPDVLRKYVFPWHKRIVDAVHARGKPVILHSCGNLSAVMEDVIACGWDAKHSFEDNIQPIWELKDEYGDRIAFLGGFDMDKISSMSEHDVRAHTRTLIEKCAPGGGWALGTGNSVASYVPVENLLAMLEEGFAAGGY